MLLASVRRLCECPQDARRNTLVQVHALVLIKRTNDARNNKNNDNGDDDDKAQQLNKLSDSSTVTHTHFYIMNATKGVNLIGVCVQVCSFLLSLVGHQVLYTHTTRLL